MKCPNCGAILDNQLCYGEWCDDWTCTECGSNLHREYYGGDYEVAVEVVEEVAEEVVGVVLCPNCYANLMKQLGYDDSDEDYTCEECGADLHRDYCNDDWEVVEEDDGDNTSAESVTPTHHSNDGGYTARHFQAYSNMPTTPPPYYSAPSTSTPSYSNTSATPQTRNSTTKRSTSSGNAVAKKKKDGWVILLSIFLMLLPIIICGIGAFVENGGISTNPNAIKVGVSYSDLEGEYYEDVIRIFEKNGFTNIEAREGEWNMFHKSGTVKSVSIDGREEFYSYTKFPKDAVIVIVYYK